MGSVVSLSVTPPTAAPGEVVRWAGAVSPVAAGRVVLLERSTLPVGTWITAMTVRTNAAGRFEGSDLAAAVGTRTSWRVVASPVPGAMQAVFRDPGVRGGQADPGDLAMRAPAGAESGTAFAVSRVAFPSKAGRPASIQVLTDGVSGMAARGTESATGGYSVRVTVARPGRYTHRMVALPWQGAASATSGARHTVRRARNGIGAPMTGRACGIDSRFIVRQAQ